MCFLNTLSVEMFAHFCLQSSSMRTLMNPKSDEEICLSDELVMVFRELAPFFYGETSQTFNMHILVDLADQVKSAGPLSSLSTMAFESAHYQLKRAVGPNTTASLATSLAVKRHQRRFFRKQSKKPDQTVTIGSLKLRHPTNCFFEIGRVGEVFPTCQSFQYNSQIFFVTTILNASGCLMGHVPISFSSQMKINYELVRFVLYWLTFLQDVRLLK